MNKQLTANTSRFTIAVVVLLSGAASGDEIRFNRDVRPILSDKCFACHGPDAKHAAADLRLDLRDEAVDYGAIVPSEPDDSEVVARIFSDDEDTIMPPVEAHKPLKPAERELLKRWIEQGAKYEPHWAYAPMQPAPDGLTENLVDHFVASALKQAGVTPVQTADRVTLIRRLSLDLTGIPPTQQEVDAFVNDPSKDAYKKLVNRLLDSPRYGERMAAYWLDLVRYADTVGYHGDQNISQWAYRDYVINAFNKNLPYDQFIREQLAGDLLPDATTEQLVASGYNRLNQTTEEGGAQAKEYLSIYFADRVRNASQVFMGSTLGCAQCHDHKYDPFTAKDFYSFGAFFADLDERGVYGGNGKRPPLLSLPSDRQRQQIADLKDAIAASESKRNAVRDELLANLHNWKPQQSVETVWMDDVQPADRACQGAWNFVSAQDNPVHSGTHSRRQESDKLVQHFFAGATKPVKVASGMRFYGWVYLDPTNPPKAIMLQFHESGGNSNAAWSHRAVWGSDDIVYGRTEESWAGYFREGNLSETGKWVRLEVDPADVGLAPKKDAEQLQIDGMAFTQFGGLAWWDKAGWTAGLPEDVHAALQIAPEKRTKKQSETIEAYYLSTSAPLTELDRQIVKLDRQLKQIEDTVPTTVVSRSVEPRTIRILPRGNWMDNSGEIVEPAIPEFLGKLDIGDRRATRLDLAKWLSHRENPLTARTMVNRLWSLLFGRGICTSVDDFGGQGTYPSNPDLLDALAAKFVVSGWDVKNIVRLIVESETYRRSSRPTPKLRETDPYNNLFARQGRFRIDAEVVRDSALAVSGLLVERIGGPSARPYQPVGYYAQLNFPKRTYTPDTGPNQYRRAVYTHWQRTFLHPMLKAFDASSREECSAQRSRSSTPLQALTLLNDPTFVEAARVFAIRILREGGDNSRERLVWAYQAAISHQPEDEIVDELSAVLKSHLEIYRKNPRAAKRLLAIGQTPVPDDIDEVELAAWTSVARTILNLHETTTRY